MDTRRVPERNSFDRLGVHLDNPQYDSSCVFPCAELNLSTSLSKTTPVDFILQHFSVSENLNLNRTKNWDDSEEDSNSNGTKASVESLYHNADNESIEEGLQFDQELGSCYGYALLNVSVLFFSPYDRTY